GRISRPLTQFLLYSSEPVLPGLSANEEGCLRFLSAHGIELKEKERWRTYADLSAEEKKESVSALLLLLHSHQTPEWKLNQLIGEVYTLLRELPNSPTRDAKEFSTLLNSCGRHGQADLGLKVASGDRGEGFAQAMILLAEHRRELREGIELLKSNKTTEFISFHFFDSGGKISETLIGIVAGMYLGSGLIDSSKPIIALTVSDPGFLKASGRGTSELVHAGLNIGLAFREVCARLGEGAEGGGHKIAAGCKFPAEKKEAFLKELEPVFAGQLGIP
ncbi:MAG: DHH family phosphoesterase, partial [Candidatus Diapherotrites archaeon]|nr:DHH family phosphoesterase [Candidatus Diapherotrites archaeon]